MKAYRQLLRWAALPIVDRRWAAPLSAVALGFGLFIGVAIGPGAAGTLATGATQIVEIPSLAGAAEGGGEDEADPGAPAPSDGPGAAEASPSSPAPIASPSFAAPPVGEFEDAGSTETAAAPPPEEEPTPQPEAGDKALAGVVVHVNRAAGSYVVAEREGELTAVHAATAPRPGAEIEVPLRPLANGTYAEAGRRLRAGTQPRAAVAGVVTFVDATPAAPAYTVSGRGASLLVHVDPAATGQAPALPALGAFANVVVEIEKREPLGPAPTEEPVPSGEPMPPEATVDSDPALSAPPACGPDATQPPPPQIWSPTALRQRRLEVEEAPRGHGDLAAIVTAVCPETGQLLVSADDLRESGGDLLLDPSTEAIDLTGLRVGDSILATAAIGVDGTLSLTGLAGDEHMRGADDVEALQGDLVATRR